MNNWGRSLNRARTFVFPTAIVSGICFVSPWIPPKTSPIFAREEQVPAIRLSRRSLVRRRPSGQFERDYELLNKFGEGGFADIYRVKHRVTGSIRAAKIVAIDSPSDLEIFTNEVDILTRLDSPYIGRIVEYYLDDSAHARAGETPRAIMISHYIEGIDLLDKVNEKIHAKSRFTESEICSIVRQILKSLSYLHQKGYIHRDVKPENYICETEANNRVVLKLIDFGLSSRVDSKRIAVERAGTSFYMAPETFGHDRRPREYSGKSDCWSVGVILATIASCGTALVGRSTSMGGSGPKSAMDRAYIQSEIAKLRQRQASETLIDLAEKLLDQQPQNRPSAAAALSHPLLTDSYKSEPSLNDNLDFALERLEAHARTPLLTKIVKLLIAHQINDSQLPQMRLLFRCLDAQSTGLIGIRTLQQSKPSIRDDFEDVLKKVDIMSTTGAVSFEGFLGACLPQLLAEDPTFMRLIFDDIAGKTEVIDPSCLVEYFSDSHLSLEVSQAVLNSCKFAVGKYHEDIHSLTWAEFTRCVLSPE